MMYRSITGIDINGHYLTAVQVIKRFGGWEITAVARIRVKEDEGLRPALQTLSESMNLKGEECIAAVSADKIFFRNLAVPFKDKRKQREVLPFELEPCVPFPIEDLVVDFLPAYRSDTPELLAVFVEKRVIGELLDALREHGADPEALSVRGVAMASLLLKRAATPNNHILLDLGEKKATLVLTENKQIVLIRTFAHGNARFIRDRRQASPDDHDDNPDGFPSLCHAVRHTVHAFGAGRNKFATPEKVFLTGAGATSPKASRFVTEYLGIPAEELDLCRGARIQPGEQVKPVWTPSLMDGALSLALASPGKSMGLNFRRDEFEIKKRSLFRSKGFRKAGVWLLVIATLWAVDMGVETYFLKQRMADLDNRILSSFKKGFPHVARIVDPVKQARIEVNEIKRASTPGQAEGMNGKALDLLLEISERLPDSIDLKVSRLVIDPHFVRIKGDTDTYNTVDRVKQSLITSTLFKTTTISSANLDRGKNRVLFEIKLVR